MKQHLPVLRAALRELATRAEDYAPDGNEPVWALISDANDALTRMERAPDPVGLLRYLASVAVFDPDQLAGVFLASDSPVRELLGAYES